MKTYKLMFCISAILAGFCNPNWHWFFIVAMCMGFVDYFYSHNPESKEQKKSVGGGGAVGY